VSNIINKTLGSLACTFLLLPHAWAETFQHAPINPIPPTTSTPTTPPSTPSVTAPPTPTAPPVAATAAPSVTRSAFTSAITSREPTNQLTRITAGQQMYYFTELTGLQGRVVNHRWERDGSFQLGLQFPVTGSPWRVHSSKNIPANLPGTWTVTVQNDDGTILKRETLIVEPSAANAPAPIVPPPAQPLTAIPPDLQRQPAERPATPVETPAATPIAPAVSATPTATPVTPPAAPTTPAPTTPTSTDEKRPIWETLAR